MKAHKVPSRWIRGPVDELAVSLGYWFDEEAGAAACEFIESFCCPSEGVGAGEPLKLLAWQRDFVMRLFGWVGTDGLRRYRRAYLEIAKKNGKSMLLSAIVLFLLMGDGEPSPKIYLNAVDKEQAGIIFDESRKMVEASPELASRLKIVNSRTEKRIEYHDNNGVVIANSSVAASKDGLNAHGVVFDELHRQPDRRLTDVFEFASVARLQPLRLDITTAGEDTSGPWHEQRERAERINSGEFGAHDIGYLGVVYRALPDDDIEDPKTWEKANPSLGEVLSYKEFAEALAVAKETPENLQRFLRFRLNVIARDEGKFIFAHDWDACGPEDNTPRRFGPEELRGLACFAGGDLGAKIDLTALVAVYGDLKSGLRVSARFYLPRENIAALERRDRVPYRAWAEAGWLTLTPGVTTDYGFLRQEVNRLKKESKLTTLALDPWNATQLCQELSEDDGVNVKEIRQGFYSLSEPTKELQALILSRKIRHEGDPLLTWCVLNAVAERDSAGNLKLSKKLSRKKIDGAAALVDAIAAAIDGKASAYHVWSERPMLIF